MKRAVNPRQDIDAAHLLLELLKLAQKQDRFC
jgi:hypothetical protein